MTTLVAQVAPPGVFHHKPTALEHVSNARECS